MRTAVATLVGLLSVAVVVTAYQFGSSDEPVVAPVDEPSRVDTGSQSDTGKELRAEPGSPNPEAATLRRATGNAVALILPTGESMPGLNGVDESVRLLWPPSRPYSPIIRKRTDPEGMDWYVHADGSQSTTQMIFRSDLDRKVAMSIVANPHEVAPLGVGDQPPQKDAGKRK